jgi:hypothetical protein
MTTAPQTALEKPATDLTTECRQVATVEILQPGDTDKHAASLNDEQLIAHVQTTLHSLRDNLPYLREARNRFAKPGQRVPVPGNPTWTEWVKTNLGKNVRTVQRWLEEPKEKKEKKARRVRTLKDWQEAQRRINDFLAAVTTLSAKVTRGADVLIPALREMAALAGCQLINLPASAPTQPEPTEQYLVRAKARTEEQKRQKELRKAEDTQRDLKRIALAKAAQNAEAEAARTRQRSATALTDAVEQDPPASK